MHIGEVSAISGLTTQTIRYYGDIGLVIPIRTSNGYRNYTSIQLNELVFLKNIRELEFDMQECRSLLEYYRCNTMERCECTRLIRKKLQETKDEVLSASKRLQFLENLLDDSNSDYENANSFFDMMQEGLLGAQRTHSELSL